MSPLHSSISVIPPETEHHFHFYSFIDALSSLCGGVGSLLLAVGVFVASCYMWPATWRVSTYDRENGCNIVLRFISVAVVGVGAVALMTMSSSSSAAVTVVPTDRLAAKTIGKVAMNTLDGDAVKGTSSSSSNDTVTMFIAFGPVIDALCLTMSLFAGVILTTFMDAFHASTSWKVLQMKRQQLYHGRPRNEHNSVIFRAHMLCILLWHAVEFAVLDCFFSNAMQVCTKMASPFLGLVQERRQRDVKRRDTNNNKERESDDDDDCRDDTNNKPPRDKEKGKQGTETRESSAPTESSSASPSSSSLKVSSFLNRLKLNRLANTTFSDDATQRLITIRNLIIGPVFEEIYFRAFFDFLMCSHLTSRLDDLLVKMARGGALSSSSSSEEELLGATTVSVSSSSSSTSTARVLPQEAELLKTISDAFYSFASASTSTDTKTATTEPSSPSLSLPSLMNSAQHQLYIWTMQVELLWLRLLSTDSGRIFVAAAIFSIAHAHHGVRQYFILKSQRQQKSSSSSSSFLFSKKEEKDEETEKTRNKQSICMASLKKALLRTCVQMFITFLFGLLAGFFFYRLQRSVPAVIVAHSLCNYLGAPDLDWYYNAHGCRYSRYEKVFVGVVYLTGMAAFVWQAFFLV